MVGYAGVPAPGIEWYTYQLAPFIDTNGDTYLTIVVNEEIVAKRRVEEFWIRQMAGEDGYRLPFENGVWELHLEGSYRSTSRNTSSINSLSKLRLPYDEDFELIPFIGEDGNNYMHLVVDQKIIQTVKVDRF